MGCWNETCAITQLPIQVGDPVVLMFLARNSYTGEDHAGFCYVNSMWTPKFLPVHGVYNDYGGIEQVEQNWNTEFILDHMKMEMAHVRLTKSHTAPVDPDELHFEKDPEQLDLDNLTIEDLVRAVHDDQLFVQGTHRGGVPVGWCMMHKWAWEHVTQSMLSRLDDPVPKEKVLEDGVEYYTALKKKVVNLLEPDNNGVVHSFIVRSWEKQDLVNWQNSFHPFTSSSGSFDGYTVLNGIRIYTDYLWELAEQGTQVSDHKVQQVLNDLSDYLILRQNMQSMRKFWSPQSGKGSQRTALDIHLALHELCVTKIKQTQAHESEWDD